MGELFRPYTGRNRYSAYSAWWVDYFGASFGRQEVGPDQEQRPIRTESSGYCQTAPAAVRWGEAPLRIGHSENSPFIVTEWKPMRSNLAEYCIA